MTKKQVTNLAASVRARLERISRESGEDFQLVVTQYAIERTLFRLSRSRFAHRFVLKGAQLFALWVGRTHRPTRDLDLLGTGDPSPHALSEIFREVCAMQIDPDGLTFDPDTVTVSEIRGNQEYPGQRVQFVVKLARMRIELQVDIGFGREVDGTIFGTSRHHCGHLGVARCAAIGARCQEGLGRWTVVAGGRSRQRVIRGGPC